MKVLLTGAAGNVGSAVAGALQREGCDLRLTDLRARRDLPRPVEVANLLDRERVYSLVEGCDTVVHAGNRPNVFSADAQRVYGENCSMNINVFQAALELGVKKVVFLSSVQVINGDRTMREGDMPPSMLKYLPLDGDTPANARNPYSQSKLAAEQLMRDYLAPHGMSCVSIRLPWVVLRGHWGHVKKSVGQRAPHLLDEAMSALHIDDAASLVAAVVRADLAGYRAYLPSMARAFSALPIPELVARYFSDVPLRRPAAELGSLVDTSRITAETGWAPRFDVHATS